MAAVRNIPITNSVDYVSTLAVFASVSLLVMMLKFFGFKASLNFNSGRNDDNIDATTVSVTGAYRSNRDDFIDNYRTPEPRKALSPSMVVLPSTSQVNPSLNTKSTSDLTKQKNLPPNLSKSAQDVSYDPRGDPSSYTNRNTTNFVDEKAKAKNEKERMKLEKRRLAEHKAREKAAAQEKAKQEKLKNDKEKQAARERKKEREKQEALERAKAKNKKNVVASLPPAPPAPPPPQNNPKLVKPTTSYSTNTMQSSISTTSGPPPYSDMSDQRQEIINSSIPNVTFTKPIEESNSWDMISQHRQQLSKPVTQGRPKAEKTMVMDLQYKLGNNNSDA